MIAWVLMYLEDAGFVNSWTYFKLVKVKFTVTVEFGGYAVVGKRIVGIMATIYQEENR